MASSTPPAKVIAGICDDHDFVRLGLNPGIRDLQLGPPQARESHGGIDTEIPVGIIDQNLRHGYWIWSGVDERDLKAIRNDPNLFEGQVFNRWKITPEQCQRVPKGEHR